MLSDAAHVTFRVWLCVVTKRGEAGKGLADRQISVVTLCNKIIH